MATVQVSTTYFMDIPTRNLLANSIDSKIANIEKSLDALKSFAIRLRSDLSLSTLNSISAIYQTRMAVEESNELLFLIGNGISSRIQLSASDRANQLALVPRATSQSNHHGHHASEQDQRNIPSRHPEPESLPPNETEQRLSVPQQRTTLLRTISTCPDFGNRTPVHEAIGRAQETRPYFHFNVGDLSTLSTTKATRIGTPQSFLEDIDTRMLLKGSNVQYPVYVRSTDTNLRRLSFKLQPSPHAIGNQDTGYFAINPIWRDTVQNFAANFTGYQHSLSIEVNTVFILFDELSKLATLHFLLSPLTGVFETKVMRAFKVLLRLDPKQAHYELEVNSVRREAPLFWVIFGPTSAKTPLILRDFPLLANGIEEGYPLSYERFYKLFLQLHLLRSDLLQKH